MRDGGVNNMKNYKIAVAGTGYVGLSIATLLSQHHQVSSIKRDTCRWQIFASVV